MAEAVAPARPIFRVLVRTLAWYVATAVVWILIRDYAPTTWGALLTDSFAPLQEGGKAAAIESSRAQGPALVPTIISMAAALVTALPVTWIYTYTRQRKGYQQSVVQTFIILPVIVAGVVVLVKHSVALAFSLGGIVAAMRFRTTLEDSKDAANIFVVTGIGLAAAVEPPVAFAISIGYNMLVLGLWYTDFGRAPSLEGVEAEQRMKRALATANRTGMFVAKLDDEVLRELAPEQLEALADRAWKRRKRHAAESESNARPEFTHLLRLRTEDTDACRSAAEPQFSGLFLKWKYMGKTKEAEGMKVLEYGVTPLETVTIGVVSDALRAIPGARRAWCGTPHMMAQSSAQLRRLLMRMFAPAMLCVPAFIASPELARAQRLFRTTDPVEVTFTTDLRTLVKDRDSTKFKPHGTVFSYTDAASGKVVSVPVTLQTRGHFRRQARNCEFPPFSMVFKKKDAENTLLQGNTKLKVSVNCKPGNNTYEQYVLQEYAAYRLYQRISPFYFRTRLAKAVFKDSLGKTPDVTTWAFFIEDEKEIAKEFKTKAEKSKGALFDQLDQPQLLITMLYEYMVGNTDYSISQQHNMSLMRDSSATVIRTVAYDFDWSGVVNPRYATPDARLGIKVVTDRIYRGPCLTVDQWKPTLDRFVAARPAIDSLYKSIPSLDPKVLKSSLEYYDDFYKSIATPKDVKRNLIDHCERDGN